MFEIFSWGMAGSLAVELIGLLGSLRSSDPLPAYYQTRTFWAVRTGVSVMAGAVAVANGASSPHLAMQIGASTPLIIEALSKSIK